MISRHVCGHMQNPNQTFSYQADLALNYRFRCGCLIHFTKCHKLHFRCSTLYPPRALKAYVLEYSQRSLPNVYNSTVQIKTKYIYVFFTEVRTDNKIKISKPTKYIFNTLSIQESLPIRTSVFLFSPACNCVF